LVFSLKKGKFGPKFKLKNDVLIRVLSKYLESHKRLVVPQLGAFLVKEPERELVFTELLRRDDGILRGLLRDEGLNEIEAAGEIDRFVFEVRHAIEHGAEFRLGELGTLKAGKNATIILVDGMLPERVAESNAPDVAPMVATPLIESVNAVSETTPVETSDVEESVTESATETFEILPEEAGDVEGDCESSVQETPKQTIRAEKVTAAVESAFADPHISNSAKRNPEPYVRGLKYGKSQKTTNAYRYIDRPMRRQGVDRFLLLAVVAAVIAVAAIAFGLWRDRHDREFEEELRMETPAAPNVSTTNDSGK